MLNSEPYLFYAAWLLFGVWSAVVAAVSLTAFHRDLFPPRVSLETLQDPSADQPESKDTSPC